MFYLFNFFNIELLFRGVLVIGMVHYLGPKAILPMVVTYAFLHFGILVADVKLTQRQRHRWRLRRGVR